MLRLQKRINTGRIYTGFILCIGLAIGLFVYRVTVGKTITPMSDGQVIKKADQYQLGAIYDRNNKLIVKGSENGVVWASDAMKEAFKTILGADIQESLNSRTTLCGNLPWLFGTEDNRFSFIDFIHPGRLRQGGSVRLTIDKKLQEHVHKLIKEYGYKKAYVVISNYQTGQLLAIYGDIFSDQFHPGSTIKPVLVAAALSANSELKGYVYNCRSDTHSFRTQNGPVHINCANGALHGSMNMVDGLTYSCNGYFISMLQHVNKRELLDELGKWGFDSVISYHQFMYWDHSFTKGSQRDIDYLLAAIGQANAYITPAGLNFCTNALMNQGVLVEPTWFTDKQRYQGSEWENVTTNIGDSQLCSTEIADSIVEMMKEVTKRGTGTSFYLPGFAAKTGTAQKSDKKGNLTNLYTVWTTGGLTKKETPYSITVCLDDVPSGVSSADAGKLAKRILTYMTQGGK